MSICRHFASDVHNMMKRSPDDCNQAKDLHNNCEQTANQQNHNDSQQKDLIYLNIYIPELQAEVCIVY